MCRLLQIPSFIVNKLINIIIVASFAGLWVATLFSSQTEIALGFVLIITFGIVHGSNDILLLSKLASQTKGLSKGTSLGLYIAIVLITFLAFYVIPILTLILFIIFSGYHFGEQHWEEKIQVAQKWLLAIFQISYGTLILAILFIFNTAEVIDIVAIITGVTLLPATLLVSLISAISLFALSLLLIIYYDPFVRDRLLTELFFLGLLTLIFKMSSLIWGFTIYFVLWHSLPSIYEQVHFIYGNTERKNIIAYVKNAFPYWIISIIGIVICYFWFRESALFYAIFFSFIAAVTFPHAFIISQMFKQKKQTKSS